jgi:hypothetical protein
MPLSQNMLAPRPRSSNNGLVNQANDIDLNKEYMYDPRRVEAKLPIFKVIRYEQDPSAALMKSFSNV